MAGELVIRVAEADHLDVWAAMRLLLWPDGDGVADRDSLSAMLAHPDQVVLLAFLDGHPVGLMEVSLREYAEGCTTSPVGYLEGWFVRPEVRRLGIGRWLVEAAESWCRARGCREIASDTEASNLDSQAAHARLGFQEAERLVCFRKSL